MQISNHNFINWKSQTIQNRNRQTTNTNNEFKEKDLSEKDLTNIYKNMNESLKLYKKYYDELMQDIPILKGSITDKIQKGEWGEKEREMINKFTDEYHSFFLIPIEDFDEYERETEKIYRTSQSIEEFKEEWFKVHKKYEEFAIEFSNKSKKAVQEEMNKYKISQENISTEPHQENNKPFKAIQGENQNKTYTREDINKEFLLNFIQNQKNKGINILELLQKFSKNSKVDLWA